MKNKWPALVQFPLLWNMFHWYTHYCVCGVFVWCVCVASGLFSFCLSILVSLCESICSYVFNYSLISKYANT